MPSNITEVVQWETNVELIATTDQVLGGNETQPANKQAAKLANRTAWLKYQKELGPQYIPTLNNANVTLAQTDVGKAMAFGISSGKTVTLPDTGTLNPDATGRGFWIANDNTSTANVTVNTSGIGTIVDWGSTYVLTPGSSIYIMVMASNFWAIFAKQEDRQLVPVGSIMTLPTANVPAGYLECNGAAVSRTTYALLFAYIGTTYGVGNGTTTFNLPDYRGEFLRGWDNSKGTDTGRTIASAQAELVGGHFHNVGVKNGATSAGNNSLLGDSAAPNANQSTDVGNTGAENRPRNWSVMYCIKYS
jgi:microcystin-dependent protein